MLTREQISKLAEKAGFGGQLRNTHRVKLELFAKMVEVSIHESIQRVDSKEDSSQTTYSQDVLGC